LPDGDRSLDVDFDHGPTLGRSFAIFYNQTRVGRLEISPGYGYGSDSQQVYTSLKIDWGRFMGFEELTQFFGTIADHVTNHDPKSNERAAALQSINYVLTKTLWDNYRILQYDQPDDQDWGDLELQLRGSPASYIERGRRWYDTKDKPRAAPASAKPTPDATPARKGVAKKYLKDTAIVGGGLLLLLLVGLLFSQR